MPIEKNEPGPSPQSQCLSKNRYGGGSGNSGSNTSNPGGGMRTSGGGGGGGGGGGIGRSRTRDDGRLLTGEPTSCLRCVSTGGFSIDLRRRLTRSGRVSGMPTAPLPAAVSRMSCAGGEGCGEEDELGYE